VERFLGLTLGGVKQNGSLQSIVHRINSNRGEKVVGGKRKMIKKNSSRPSRHKQPYYGRSKEVGLDSCGVGNSSFKLW